MSYNEVESEILHLINNLRKAGYKIPGYNYNQYRDFIPGITPVYYSGPYFGDKEIIESIKTILVGKWMSAGENVIKF